MPPDRITTTGPLQGIRVLEFSHIYAGPFAGMHLADLGADVIKVEAPGGESFRHTGSVVPGTSKTFQWLNRGKRSLVLNATDPRGLAVIQRLMPTVDVVLINYRPGVPQRLGIDYVSLCRFRPDLVYMDITGFGPKGPWASEAASDIVAQAYSGAMAAEGKLAEDGAPQTISSLAVGDLVAGLSSAMGVCAALLHRSISGEGQLVEASLVRSAMSVIAMKVNSEPVADAVLSAPVMGQVHDMLARSVPYADIIKHRDGSGLKPSSAAFYLYYGGYVAKDGALVLGALTPENREAIRGVLGTDDDPTADPEFDALDPANAPKIAAMKQRIRQLIRERTVDEWVHALRKVGAPVSPVNFAEDLFEDAQASSYMVDFEHPLTGRERQVGPVVDMSKTATAISRPAPVLGEHSSELLLEVGYSPDAITALRDARVIA